MNDLEKKTLLEEIKFEMQQEAQKEYMKRYVYGAFYRLSNIATDQDQDDLAKEYDELLSNNEQPKK